MISFPESYDDLTIPAGAVVRSGGTDLQERLRSHNASSAIVDLTGISGFAGITVGDDSDGVRIGGGTRMATVARELMGITAIESVHPHVAEHRVIEFNVR